VNCAPLSARHVIGFIKRSFKKQRISSPASDEAERKYFDSGVRPETVEYIIKKKYRAHAKDEPREKENERRSLSRTDCCYGK
jgi:hypothetical protein